MVISLILLCIIGGISFYSCRKIFFDKIEVIKSNSISKIILQITFVMSNLILSFVIIQLLLTINESDLKLWKLFLFIICVFFYYLLPIYLIYNLFDHTKIKGILQIIGVFLLHLILSNILYRFFKGTYEESLFEFNFYINQLNILEYLAFIGDLFNGVSGAYNAVNNISSFFIYPLLKRRNLINPDNSDIKKKLEEVNDKISLKQIKLSELSQGNNSDLEQNNSSLNTSISYSSLSESKRSLQNELEKLKSIQLSYEYQLGVGKRKDEKSKQDGKIEKIVNLIKVIQGFVFVSTAFLRILTLDYSEFNLPIDIKQESIIKTIHRFSLIKFSNFFLEFIEQIISLSLVFVLFGMNWSVSRDRIMECISFVFSYLKNKVAWYNVQLLIVCIMIFSYYLICGILVVNSMPNLVFKDKLHRYLYPGFDFENLHWYYDCPYVLAASFFIVKEIIEYSNIISTKQKQ